VPFGKRLRRHPVRESGVIYGVTLTIEASNRELLNGALELMPPAWMVGAAGDNELHLRLEQTRDETYLLTNGDRELSAGPLEEIWEDLDRTVRLHLAHTAPNHLFLHAGAVAYEGQGIVIPGASFSGKTSLVAALVRAGAEYYSDENAVFDDAGLLHPYPKPLGLRLVPGEPTQTNRHVSTLGGTSGDVAIPLALVVAAEYRPGAIWEPAELSPAEIITCLLQHTFRGLSRPKESIDVLHRAAAKTVGVRGERGDADAVAADLLARLDTGAD
jgi:hypothetical protein